MRLSIIVAVAADEAIGRRGDLLFHISDDLRRFKAITLGHPVIMGRKTFESFPNGPLPGRRNIVVTRNAAYSHDGAETAASLDEALQMTAGEDEVFIIGGGEIYREAMPMVDRLLVTEIDARVADADTFFPPIPAEEWRVSDRSEPMTDPRSGVRYRFVAYNRQ
ncbi:MAG: dihydrofolate reductase [Muribaculaceae bacterium]